MDKTNLNSYFHSLFPIESKTVEKITETFKSFTLDKNTRLLEQGKISTQTYFLEEGYMRSYILNEEGEEGDDKYLLRSLFRQ